MTLVFPPLSATGSCLGGCERFYVSQFRRLNQQAEGSHRRSPRLPSYRQVTKIARWPAPRPCFLPARPLFLAEYGVILVSEAYMILGWTPRGPALSLSRAAAVFSRLDGVKNREGRPASSTGKSRDPPGRGPAGGT